MNNKKDFSELLGKVIVKVENLEIGDDEIIFTLDNGDRYKLYHDQNCCEQVYINDVNGDLTDLLDSPITLAEESTNQDNPPHNAMSWTWTFYRLATVRGYLDIKWLGQSNGYYSEKVDFIKL